MPFLHIVILAAVQGLTEFLPISSTAHLRLVTLSTGWPDQGLVMDVAVHVGTLFAVILYFWRDLWRMVMSLANRFSRSAAKRRTDDDFWLAIKLIVATLPTIGAGLWVDQYVTTELRTLEVIAWATLGFAVLLYFADQANMTVKRMNHIGLLGALFIGIFQVLALIPGTSRAGITMTAARFMGVERHDAARFSMLLSIPVIIGAGVLKGSQLYRAGDAQLTSDAFTAAGLAFLFALVAIALLMQWLKRASFTPFVLYRVILGGLLLYVAYWAPGLLPG
ncbi:MAG: undecaprenyl-diphosphate phosphatase [Rhodospirillales bacterium]|nr:undecaprenyl-diphosphate phosphatase [Rhodospirillales bacterium]